MKQQLHQGLQLAGIIVVLGGLYGGTPATAAPPDAVEIIQRMKDALEPTRPSTRKVVFSVKGQQGEETQWVAGKAFKPLADGKRTLIVISGTGGSERNRTADWGTSGRG